MSSPSEPESTPEAPRSGQPGTQEIPVVTPAAAQPLPPHPGATPPAPVQEIRTTGPVDMVPGLPGPPPPPPPAAAPAPPTATPAPPADGGATAVTEVTSWPESLNTGPVPFAEAGAPREPRARREPRDRRALVGIGLVVLALVALELGLSLRFGGESFWSDIPLWSAFATVCTVLGLAGFASLLPGRLTLDGRTGWRVAAGGLVGLAVFWLLVVLPVVAGDRGFLLTAALGCLGGALWVGPARKA